MELLQLKFNSPLKNGCFLIESSPSMQPNRLAGFFVINPIENPKISFTFHFHLNFVAHPSKSTPLPATTKPDTTRRLSKLPRTNHPRCQPRMVVGQLTSRNSTLEWNKEFKIKEFEIKN